MTILGIETSTAVCGAAVVRNGAVVAESQLAALQAHSEKLLSVIDVVLGTAGIALKDLDGIACSIGPGSFTGLRIGLSAAKGLAFASDLPLAAVPTLAALADRAVRDGRARKGDRVLATIDARRDEVYAALYCWNGDSFETLIPQTAMTVSALLDALGGSQRIVLVGDGSEKVQRSASGSLLAERFALPLPGQEICSAGSVALLGERRLSAGERADIASLEPDYVKDFYTTATPISQQG